MPKQIPFVVIRDEPLKVPLPDGLYGLISFRGDTTRTRYGFSVRNPFPWMISFTKFEGGLCDFIGGGSDIADQLVKHSVNKVLITPKSDSLMAELAKKLAIRDVELVPA